MKIKKPYNFILSKKFPDRYFDWNTFEEFPYTEINKHPEWYKFEYDADGNEIYYENSKGSWIKYEYDVDGFLIYHENSDGDWYKYEYDADGNRINYENSDGVIIDNRR